MELPKISLIFFFISFVIVSWISIHLMAIFGVFAAVAAPLWWILFPEKTFCFVCRTKKTKTCSFSHSLLTGGTILVFTFVSFCLVFGESRVLFKLGFPPTPKTVTFVIPKRGEYRLGEIFPMKIDIFGIKKPINAVQADLGFDPERVEVVDISTEDSFASIFVQKEINNEIGYARLTGGLPNPGFFADRGVFGTLWLKAKSPGVTKVEFLPSSLVLANDGRGTNVLKELASASYLILPEKISEEEVEMQKSLVFKPAVLGEKTEETQMKFYNEGEVLGAQVGREIEKGKKVSLGRVFLDIFEKVDRAILTLWGKIFFF